jgi:hypothetical protein
MSMFAFVSILFTYYVNFHLVGLHSYAKAVKHTWVGFVFTRTTIFIGAITHPKYRKYYKK